MLLRKLIRSGFVCFMLLWMGEAFAQKPPTVPIPSTLFGMHTIYPAAGYNGHLSADWPTVSFGSLGKCSFVGWEDIEVTEGVFTWSLMDACVNMAASHNMDVFWSG